MQVTLVVGNDGKIVGTANHVQSSDPAMGHGGPVAGPGQSLYVIDMPNGLEKVKDAEELHRRLQPYVPAR
jgi:hypothetical protein